MRVIAASNRHIREMVGQDEFREDLYYRLACITVDLPPLRARRSDIPVISEALLARLNMANRLHCYLSGEALDKLMNYDFPGNVRELRNVLQRAVAMSSSTNNGAIGVGDIVFDSHRPGNGAEKDISPRFPVSQDKPMPSIRDLESSYMADLLTRYGGQRRAVAEVMGISERTLYRKLRRYGLN